MGPRKKPISDNPGDAEMPTTITVVPPKAEAPAASNLPSVVRFPLYVILSFSLSALLKSVYYELNGPSLELISSDGDRDWQLAATTVWKILELGLGWYCGLDAMDMFSFSALTHIPHAIFLNSFYLVPLSTLAFLLTTTCISNALPLRLLRRRGAHNLPTRQTNEQIASDPTIKLLNALLATLLYAIPLLVSYTTWLPQHLAVHFAGLKTLDPAHHATLPSVAVLLLPIGYFALRFAFEPAAHALSSAGPTLYAVPLEFDPATASLSQTLHRNVLWHLYLPARTQAALRRTVALMLWTFANTAFWAWVEIEGAEAVGAIGWGLVWGVGAGTAGLSLSWVAGVLS